MKGTPRLRDTLIFKNMTKNQSDIVSLHAMMIMIQFVPNQEKRIIILVNFYVEQMKKLHTKEFVKMIVAMILKKRVNKIPKIVKAVMIVMRRRIRKNTTIG